MVEMTPHADHTTSERPAEPVSFTTPVGLTKMPEPMIVPIIMPTPLMRVMLRLSTTFSALVGESLPVAGLAASAALEAGTMGVVGDVGCSASAGMGGHKAEDVENTPEVFSLTVVQWFVLLPHS